MDEGPNPAAEAPTCPSSSKPLSAFRPSSAPGRRSSARPVLWVSPQPGSGSLVAPSDFPEDVCAGRWGGEVPEHTHPVSILRAPPAKTEKEYCHCFQIKTPWDPPSLFLPLHFSFFSFTLS